MCFRKAPGPIILIAGETTNIPDSKIHDPLTSIAKHITKLVRNAGSDGIDKEVLQKKLDISTKVSSEVINTLISQGLLILKN